MKHFRIQQGKHNKQSLWFALSFLILILTGCGGEGDDGGGQTAITYTGKTTQVKLTPENSGKIMSQVQNFDLGLDDVPLLEKSSVSTLESRQYLQLYDVVQKIQASIFDQSRSNKPVPVNETGVGNCGGQITIKGSVDDDIIEFDLTIQFKEFCEDATTISGTINLQGKQNELTMTLTGLTVTDVLDSITMQGSIVIDALSSSRSTMAMNLVVRNNASGKTFKFENYRLDITEGRSSETFTLSGRFFSSDEGFIDLRTPTPFFILSSSEFPSSGVLEISGLDGTQARLTALSTLEFQLEVDADGNGVFEFTITGPWENLENTTF